jgi:hypothetical protein
MILSTNRYEETDRKTEQSRNRDEAKYATGKSPEVVEKHKIVAMKE